MCVGPVESGEKSGIFREVSLESCPSILGVCPCVL